jgi:hypothetical protein
MNSRLTLFGLALLLVGLLALFVSGLVSETLIVPLLYLLWLARVVVASIPQAAIWALLLVLAAPLLWRSLARPRSFRLRPPTPPAPRAPVASWAELFRRAERDHYGRWLLAQRLSQLALGLLTSQEQRTTSQLWRMLQDEAQGAPVEIRAYLQAGAEAYSALPRRWRWPVRGQPAAPRDPLDLDPEVVLRFLEGRRARVGVDDGM